MTAERIKVIENYIIDGLRYLLADESNILIK
jgi:hypothetical protein